MSKSLKAWREHRHWGTCHRGADRAQRQVLEERGHLQGRRPSLGSSVNLCCNKVARSYTHGVRDRARPWTWIGVGPEKGKTENQTTTDDEESARTPREERKQETKTPKISPSKWNSETD